MTLKTSLFSTKDNARPYIESLCARDPAITQPDAKGNYPYTSRDTRSRRKTASRYDVKLVGITPDVQYC